jgi:hypothetical protein
VWEHIPGIQIQFLNKTWRTVDHNTSHRNQHAG